MLPALWVSKTGLAAQDKAMSAVANNLANVNTNGFKSDRVVFEDLFYAIELQPGAQADEVNTVPSGIQLGSGVRVAGTQKVFTEGSIQTTGQPMDLAIIGAGDGVPALLAWIYTGLRVIHTIVQVTANKVMVRFVLFAVSSVVLIALIGIAAARVFG